MTEKSCEELSVRRQDLTENLKVIREKIAQAALRSGRTADQITLLAATKTVPAELINFGISQGITHIGENRVQELMDKFDQYAPCEKHFIGVLQSNKVKYLPSRVKMIESCSSIKLAQEISRQAQKQGIVMPVLIEVNIGREESKDGIDPDAILETAQEMAGLPGISVQGLMAIPPATEKILESEKYFVKMMHYYVDIGAKKMDNVNMHILSMGMSADYELAIACGATEVRIGSLLFGKRIYQH